MAEFIGGLILPLDQPILVSEPRLRSSRPPADGDQEWQVRRSSRLARKSGYRDPNPERQARRILLSKWGGRPEDASSKTPDDAIAARFHKEFGHHASSSKHDAMRELFPQLARRSARPAIWRD